MISLLNFYQDTWSQDLIYFHPWAAVQLMQDGILSLARPPRKYQKDLASSLNTMLCERREEEKREEERPETKFHIFSPS
jgi:hypothetical protein